MQRATFIEPMLALAVSQLPSGHEWEYELKLDGYRGAGREEQRHRHRLLAEQEKLQRTLSRPGASSSLVG